MAVTVSKGIQAGWPMQNIDGRQMQLVNFTFDGDYPAGGEALAASDCGMTRIDAVVVLGAAVSADGLTAAVVSFNHAAGKLAAFVSAGDGDVLDEAGATDVDGLSVRLLVLGAL